MKRILITTALLSTLVLTGCGKSDAYQVGRCMAGQMSMQTDLKSYLYGGAAHSVPLTPFVKMAFNISAKQTGLSSVEMEKGFTEYKPGDDVTESCKTAQALTAKYANK